MNVYEESERLQTSGNNWAFLRPSSSRRAQGNRLLSFEQPEITASTDRSSLQFIAEDTEAMAALKREYVLPRDSSVEEYLAGHRSVVPVLMEGARRLRDLLGPTLVLSLSVLIDDFSSRTLYASIMWRGNVNDVRHALKHFDESWWIAHSGDTGGDLCFTYELV